MAAPKRPYTIIVALALVIISLITFSLINFGSSEKTGLLKKTVLEIAAPLEDAANSAFTSIGLAWERYVLLVGLERENRELNAKITSLMIEVNNYREMSIEYVRLRKLMDIEDDSKNSTVVARVVGRNRLSVFKNGIDQQGNC